MRVEDAKNATFAAVEEGIVPGGMNDGNNDDLLEFLFRHRDAMLLSSLHCLWISDGSVTSERMIGSLQCVDIAVHSSLE